MNLPTVCVGYMHRNEHELLKLSVGVMNSYNWVHQLVILDTSPGQFGSGFDKQPEDGGFHEIGARNTLLSMCRETGCDWTLICDADEFFAQNTWYDIKNAHDSHKVAIWFSCYHFCSPKEHLWFPNTVKTIDGVEMHDPHPRAFRNSYPFRYVPNNNNRFRKGLKNWTTHCHVQRTPTTVVRLVNDIRHVHVHHMFDPKRPNEKWIREREKRPRSGSFTFPGSYVEAFKKQQEVKKSTVE